MVGLGAPCGGIAVEDCAVGEGIAARNACRYMAIKPLHNRNISAVINPSKRVSTHQLLWRWQLCCV